MKTHSVTIKDIAAEVGVSVRTVSLALNNQGRLSAATRERILQCAKARNYHPNTLARGLVTRQT